MQIRSPTQFPIVPLRTTLARTRAKSKIRHRRMEVANLIVKEELAEVRREEELAVVDNYGRTRAASRRFAAMEPVRQRASEKHDEDKPVRSPKRKMPQGHGKRHQRVSKRR
jgi:hypothetical protein